MKNRNQETDVVILGAGITGLSVAYFLRHQLNCLIVEAADEPGGVIKTRHQNGFTLEYGPDCFMNQKPWALDLALELGLQSDLTESKDFQRRVLLLKNKQFEITDHQNSAVAEFLGNRTQLRVNPNAFISFKTGMQKFTDKLCEYLPDRLLLNTRAVEIDWLKKIITLNTGLKIKTKAILLALPASETAALLGISLPFKTTQTTSVYLAYPRESIAHPLDAFGAIVPASENLKMTAMTFVSSKFDHRCPEGFVLFRIFLKGELKEAQQELNLLFSPKSKPVLETSFKLSYADPKYALDHFEHVDALEKNLSQGVFVAGSPYRGVGIADCVYQAKSVSEKILKL